ncbi:MAG: gamma-glutamyl-gamma-aminobutyrate hydrolase family protein [Alphaproteobacteria bacterium]|jgi:putative glutamine amidotransferase|nr:gamma-glutamyl-gamma-aminobutyrate hydrolase family protein [Alphaproteobacteria bacterium]MBT5827455.1 gamma-glutamyl-gamma-aminobutyrate hydrolase family protein [Alphaproteobacteria bacterium]
MKKPVIGITLDHENDQKYSALPYYALRENYIRAVQLYGGTPILLPFENSEISNYLSLIDGLLITGGNFDISPSLYGNGDIHNKTSLKESRTSFEWNLTKEAISLNKPILGICGGMQLLNVILGGDLIQHIPDEIENALEHEVKPYDNPAHTINIKAGSLLYKLAEDKKVIGVNSSHHQAVKNLPKNIIASGISSDSVIEAIEHSNYNFMLGVQWHPEYLISQLDHNIFKEFVNATK